VDALIWLATVAAVAALLWATQTGQRLVVLLPLVVVTAAVVVGGLYFNLGGPAWPYVAIIAVTVVNVLPRRANRDRSKSGSDSAS
jgi:hypothetical protein